MDIKYPDNVVWRPQAGSQEAFLSATPVTEVLLHGSRGGGKSIADNTQVLTNSGWKRADAVTMTDQLVAEDGSYTRLLGIYPQPLHEKMYRVTFKDGGSVVVSGDHKWKVGNRHQRKKGWMVKTTFDMHWSSDPTLWHIPYMEKSHGGKKWEGYDPYVLGLLLGDGTIKWREDRNNYASVILYGNDDEIQEYVEALGWTRCWTKTIPGNRSWPDADTARRILNDLEGGGTSFTKKIPQTLMDADADTRLALLQGLMDTDGSADKNGSCSYQTISPTLALQVYELVFSLGGKAVMKQVIPPGNPDINPHYIQWRIAVSHSDKFNPFRLPRKAERIRSRKSQMRSVVKIEETEPTPHRCFTVEHESHCFVVQDHIVTHNTDALLMSFGIHVGLGFGSDWRGILFRQTYKQLADVIAKTQQWFPRIWPRARWNGTEHSWSWESGEKLLLRQFAREADYWSIHGHQYPWIGWEELCNWHSDVGYKRLFSCCRSTNPHVPRMIRATTNPYGPGHNWVKARFLPDQTNMKVRKDLISFEGHKEPPRLAIFSPLEENKILLKADPDYISKIAASARNEAERRAWMEGSWDIVSGGMFDDVWDPSYNVVAPFHIPLNWRIDRSFDWGSSKPFSVGWWATATGEDVPLPDGGIRSTIRGDLYRIDEMYGWTGRPNEGRRLLASEISEEIVRHEIKLGFRDPRNPHWCRVKTGVADSSIFTAENGNCIATDMQAKVRMDDGVVYRGVRWSPADKSPGSRATGWDQMRRMLKNAHPSRLGPREKPGLFVFDRCENFIRTVPVLPRDELDQDDIDDSSEDHIADETRYRVRAVGVKLRSGQTVGMH